MIKDKKVFLGSSRVTEGLTDLFNNLERFR